MRQEKPLFVIIIIVVSSVSSNNKCLETDRVLINRVLRAIRWGVSSVSGVSGHFSICWDSLFLVEIRHRKVGQ